MPAPKLVFAIGSCACGGGIWFDSYSVLGPVTAPFSEDLYFGKLDWELTDNDKLEFSAKVRREDSRDSVGGITTADAAKNNANKEDRYDLNWSHYGDVFLNEARITYENPIARRCT